MKALIGLITAMVSIVTLSSRAAFTYENSTYDFSFDLKDTWEVIETDSHSIELIIKGYWPEYLGDYKTTMEIFEKNSNESFDSWFDREIRPKYPEPFNKRNCEISKETPSSKIAYCDFGGVIHFVMSKDGTRIISLPLGQDFPPELDNFSEKVRFK